MRLSMNLRHVMEHHLIHFPHTNPPSSMAAINFIMPIYMDLEASLLEAEQLLYFAPEDRWRALTTHIQQCFVRLDNQWSDYLLHRQITLREIFFAAAQQLQEAADQVQALRIARTTCATEANRIQLKNLLQLSAAIRASHENLHASFHVLVEAFPGADRP
jgi:hypothetical protein